MEDAIRQNHNIIIEDRKKFTLTGVKDVLSFDDETITLETHLGKLVIKGSLLHIINFSNEIGELSGEGKVHAFVYTSEDSGRSFLSRLFR